MWTASIPLAEIMSAIPKVQIYVWALYTEHYQETSMLLGMLEDGVSSKAELPRGAAASLSEWRFAVEET